MIKFIFSILIITMTPIAFSSDLLINFNGNLIDKKCEIKQSEITIQFIPYSLGYIEVNGNIQIKNH